MRLVYVEDILYTNNGKGEYKASKIGNKYDYRRNKYYVVESTNTTFKNSYDFYGIDMETKELNGDYIYTTEKSKETLDSDGYLYLETINSIYKCKLIEDNFILNNK